ncbi:hypothetical protein TIFTF001_054466 [Ficus carica]|uniref:Uncharacterized protein n=1 Tax=Ficus carica TaxID=3494 RepID=A0AA88JHG7_FICCA|nr:hypothetical protein TIFTF001_054466 [Ficus carica]
MLAGPDRVFRTGLTGPGQGGPEIHGALFARWSGAVRTDRLDRSRSGRSDPDRVFSTGRSR